MNFGPRRVNFYERIWASDKSLWHVTLVNPGSDNQTAHFSLNSIMSQLMKLKKISFLNSLLPVAYASEDFQCFMPEALKNLKGNPAAKEEFINKYLSWDKELAKLDITTGRPLPSAPTRTRVPAGLSDAETIKYHDEISNMTHFPIK